MADNKATSAEKRLAELQSEHGELVVEEVTGIACRRPKWAELDAFISKADKGSKLGAMRDLVISTAVYPSLEEVKAAILERPGVVATLANQLTGVAGFDLAAVVRKS
jgi:hypothetical protein